MDVQINHPRVKLITLARSSGRYTNDKPVLMYGYENDTMSWRGAVMVT